MADRLQYAIAGRRPWGGMWLNRHYCARELAKREKVVYVLDPLPSRPSRRREARAEMRREDVGGREPDGVTTVRLPEIPLQRFAIARAWNTRMGTTRVRRHLDPDVPTVLVYLPRARLFPPGALGEALTVYLVNDYYRRGIDGIRDDHFCDWEDEILRRADLVVAVSDAIRDGFAGRHENVHAVENGYDPAFFHPPDGPEPPEVADLPHPRIGFVGAARPPILDLSLTLRVAAARPSWSFCFVGWHDESDPDLRKLRDLPNAHVLGPRPREELAGYVGAMDAMTCPYVKTPFTGVASPLKAWESIAVGRPLVALHIPALNEHQPILRSVNSEEEYLAALDEVVAGPRPDSSELAARCTWEARAAQLRSLIVETIEA